MKCNYDVGGYQVEACGREATNAYTFSGRSFYGDVRPLLYIRCRDHEMEGIEGNSLREIPLEEAVILQVLEE